ncbi:GWxTD domain-containing protein [candidate division KSB1 bacterium]|nr:GWxTD domain-containing protein [candidate division KSB1 bacterium]RQW06030.1 MAG: GWxTD domain-containing protein [candidate division KSB1 bacterium]
MFIDKIDTTETGVHYIPNLTHVFDDVNSAFAAHIELYPPEKGNDVEAELGIYDKNGSKLYAVEKSYPSTLDIVSAVVPFRQHLTKPGEYYFVVSVKSGKQTAKIQRLFSVFWGNVPLAKTNLEIAIEQLALVAHKRDVEKMRTTNETEQNIIYNEFWRQRDPTPNTQRNELKEEFFHRVDFANRNFTEIVSGRSGWQTDRGKIYIVYGAPDNVDRRESEITSIPSAETWYYNRLNRKYIFADRNGEGIYRLVRVE